MKPTPAFRKWGLCALAALFALSVSGAAFADGAGEIKYRQSVMKAIGGHFGALIAIGKGATANQKDLMLHAKALDELAKVTPRIFPKGSGPEAGKTEALPKIWTDWNNFKKGVTALETGADAVLKAAKTGDKGKLLAAVGSMGKNACKACHDTYLEKR